LANNKRVASQGPKFRVPGPSLVSNLQVDIETEFKMTHPPAEAH